MSHRGHTKEELFLKKLYEMATAQGDIWSEVDRQVIGKLFGEGKKAIDTIVQHLTQANFIKKGEEGVIYLTPHGAKFVEHEFKKNT